MKDLIQQETLAIKARLSNMNRGRNKHRQIKAVRNAEMQHSKKQLYILFVGLHVRGKAVVF